MPYHSHTVTLEMYIILTITYILVKDDISYGATKLVVETPASVEVIVTGSFDSYSQRLPGICSTYKTG